MRMLTKKKVSLLVKRPEPPTFNNIVEDIVSAPDDDVVFTFSDYSPLTDDSPIDFPADPLRPSKVDSFGGHHASSKPFAASGTTMILQDEGTSVANDQLDVEDAYRRAAEFIESMDKLKLAPARLRESFASLESSSEHLLETIESLRRHAEELRTYRQPSSIR